MILKKMYKTGIIPFPLIGFPSWVALALLIKSDFVDDLLGLLLLVGLHNTGTFI